MGYGIMAYVVDLDGVRSVVGSGDETKAAVFGELFEANFGEDKIAEMSYLEDPPTAEEVARHVVLGQPYDDRVGFAYGYFFETVCMSFGSMLPNNAWCPCGSKFVRQVDEFLAAAGVPAGTLSVQSLAWGGGPVELPPTDFPGIGWLPRDRVAAALDAVAPARLGEIGDADIEYGVDELRGWLDRCARGNRDLVCFYY